MEKMAEDGDEPVFKVQYKKDGEKDWVPMYGDSEQHVRDEFNRLDESEARITSVTKMSG